MIDLSKISISTTTTAIQAMHIIDKGGVQLALVVDSKRRLLGTFTDGDARRGLLHGLSLETPVKQLMNSDFRFVRTDFDKAYVLEMMRKDVLRQIPVLDSQGCVVELLLHEELLQPTIYPNPVVIMAGGKGTRMRPYTNNCPKPMLKVDGKPMLEIQLEHFISSGFKQFYFSVNYLKDQIIDYFGHGDRWGVSIDYLVENEPLGTAGSLQLLPKTIEEPLLVINGDVLTRFNPSQLLDFHFQHSASATLCVRDYEVTVPFGVVQTNGIELIGFEEKPTYKQVVNAGFYVIDSQLLSLIPKEQFMDMPTLLNCAREVGYHVNVCPIHEYWIDVGRPETLNSARKEWASN